MRSSTWVDVDLSRIVRNYRSVERLTGKRVIAIVKANAYGHGMVSVATGLAAHVKDLMVGVGTPEEAIELRESGYSQRILVMGFSQPEILHRVLPLDCEFAVWDRVQIARMSQEANRLNLRAKAHLYVDMDMGRFGCSVANAAELVQAILDDPCLELSGVIGHLPSVDEAFSASAEQVRSFNSLRRTLQSRTLQKSYLANVLFHLSSSAAIDLMPDSDFDAVRAGLVLYGGVEPRGRLENAVHSVLSWKAVVQDLRAHRSGDLIGYGGEYICSDREELIAVLGVGYADGYRRVPKNCNRVILEDGSVAPVVGRICTQHCMIKVPRESQSLVKLGSEAVLLGAVRESRLTAGALALAWGTNEWDVLCNISRDVPRRYEHKILGHTSKVDSAIGGTEMVGSGSGADAHER